MCDVKFLRKCPSCNCDILHKQKGHRDEAQRKGRVCKNCKGKLKKSPNQSLTRCCPSCFRELSYPNAGAQRRAEKLGRKCYSCANKSFYDDSEKTRLSRVCPKCSDLISHTKVYSRRRAEKKQTPCKSCRAKSSGEKLKKSILLDKDSIYQDYYINELTAEQIAIKYSLKKDYIHRVLKKWNFTHDLHASKLHEDGLRKCKKCDLIKPLSNFDSCDWGLFGLNSQCSDCDYQTKKAYQEKYYERERDNVKLRSKLYRQNNPEKVRETSRIKTQRSRKNNPHIHRMKGLLRRFITATKQNKTTRTTQMLGYTYDDFKNFIHSFDLPLEGNHVDHKLPISWFKENVPAHICNSLNNLQVISENENEVKSQWWAHPIPKIFFEENKIWIKNEYLNRFILVQDHYLDTKSPFYLS